MCVCGGIIEVGIICGLIGCIGKVVHKCNCKCHEQIECSHCEKHEHSDKKRKTYNVIQTIFKFVIFASVCTLLIGSIIEHHKDHKEVKIENIQN